jgi:hypothetical protein
VFAAVAWMWYSAPDNHRSIQRFRQARKSLARGGRRHRAAAAAPARDEQSSVVVMSTPRRSRADRVIDLRDAEPGPARWPADGWSLGSAAGSRPLDWTTAELDLEDDRSLARRNGGYRWQEALELAAAQRTARSRTGTAAGSERSPSASERSDSAERAPASVPGAAASLNDRTLDRALTPWEARVAAREAQRPAREAEPPAQQAARRSPVGRPESRLGPTRPDARQAPARRSDGRSAPLRQPEPRQPEPRQPEARKPEARKPEARKPEARKPEARKPEARKPEARQPEARRAQLREAAARQAEVHELARQALAREAALAVARREAAAKPRPEPVAAEPGPIERRIAERPRHATVSGQWDSRPHSPAEHPDRGDTTRWSVIDLTQEEGTRTGRAEPAHHAAGHGSDSPRHRDREVIRLGPLDHREHPAGSARSEPRSHGQNARPSRHRQKAGAAYISPEELEELGTRQARQA